MKDANLAGLTRMNGRSTFESQRKEKKTATPSTSDYVLPVFVGLLVLRLINAFSIRTFFQPDEYFQSLEPAWQIAFGPNAGAWLTWEWKERLRSSLHPMMFAGVYKAVAQFNSIVGFGPSTKASILIAAPKVLQAVTAASGDLFTWLLGSKVYGKGGSVSWAVLALTALSPWQFFCSVRTFSNSLETALTVVGLYYWPWDWFLEQDGVGTYPRVITNGRRDINKEAKEGVQQLKGTEPAKPASEPASKASVPGNLYLALSLAGLACILRPTNIIIWATIAITLVYRYQSDGNKVLDLARATILCGSAVLAVSIAADYAYFGAFTIPAINFLYFNVVNGLSSFYGTNRPDYYFTEGLPLLLTTALPFALVGLSNSLRPCLDKPGLKGYNGQQMRFVLATAVMTTVLAFTAQAHKEVRFIYPLLPILHVLAAKPLADLFLPFPNPTSRAKLGLMALMLTLNIWIAAYVSLFHQAGVVDVIHFLRHEQEARFSREHSTFGSKNMTVGFFMPCHSTPWRSHLVHPGIKAWALTCEPPLHLSLEERQWYQDEADIFYAHPGAWIEENMADRRTIVRAPKSASVARNRGRATVEKLAKGGEDGLRPWPEYLVFFEHLESAMNAVLKRTKYRECWRGFNSHWHDDRRRKGDVVVWCLKDE